LGEVGDDTPQTRDSLENADRSARRKAGGVRAAKRGLPPIPAFGIGWLYLVCHTGNAASGRVPQNRLRRIGGACFSLPSERSSDSRLAEASGSSLPASAAECLRLR
jgi:hypothetical protein